MYIYIYNIYIWIYCNEWVICYFQVFLLEGKSMTRPIGNGCPAFCAFWCRWLHLLPWFLHLPLWNQKSSLPSFANSVKIMSKRCCGKLSSSSMRRIPRFPQYHWVLSEYRIPQHPKMEFLVFEKSIYIPPLPVSFGVSYLTISFHIPWYHMISRSSLRFVNIPVSWPDPVIILYLIYMYVSSNFVTSWCFMYIIIWDNIW